MPKCKRKPAIGLLDFSYHFARFCRCRQALLVPEAWDAAQTIKHIPSVVIANPRDYRGYPGIRELSRLQFVVVFPSPLKLS